MTAAPGRSRPSRKVSFKQQTALNLDIQVNIALVEVRLHAVLGVWFVWQVGDFGIAGYGSVSDNSEHTRGDLAIRINSQALALETWKDPDDPTTILSDFSFTFPFPPLHVSGRIRDNLVKCRGTFELFEILLNANAVDAFVRASRQLASSDLDRLFTLFQRSQSAMPTTARVRTQSLVQPVSNPIDLRAQFLLSGFRLVLEGESSLCFFDVKDVSGYASGSQAWRFKVSDVSFSLAPKAAASTSDFDRRYRLAYMVFDLETISSVDPDTGTQSLEFNIDKVHAVLQAAALGVIGDLVDSYQVSIKPIYTSIGILYFMI